MRSIVHDPSHSLRGAAPLALSLALLGVLPPPLAQGAQSTPPAPALTARVDAAVNAILVRTGVPSASIALVRDAEVFYAQAYGLAQLEPRRPAAPGMRYAVGSISKEFTAAALLLLQQSHRVSIDDAAGKWLPGLGPAAGVSIRALLSHTAGIRDFWPQDYDPPEMLRPIEPQEIVARWAGQRLDFPAGTSWQYSNTGYTIAGLIAQRAAGKPLFAFLQERIFEPLKMSSVFDFDAGPLPAGDATGYMRYALGPPRPAAKEGRGWLFGAGELAMTASDLALWDIAIIERRVLNDASYRALTTEVRLANGAGTSYGLGLDVMLQSGLRVLAHGGEVGGFTAANRIYPDNGVALVVMTNEDATDASGTIADALADLLVTGDSATDAPTTAGARDLLRGLQAGSVDRKRLTANAASYFTPQALEDFRTSLGSLGEPKSFILKKSGDRGGFATRVYEAAFSERTLRIVVRSTADGLIEQYTVSAN
jgi:CubicO group peptidase (beta-lactamase class C family)